MPSVHLKRMNPRCACSAVALMSQPWTAAGRHLPLNEARTSGICAVNGPLTRLFAGLVFKTDIKCITGGRREGQSEEAGQRRRDLWERQCRKGMRDAPSAKSNHIIQRDIVSGGERMATK